VQSLLEHTKAASGGRLLNASADGDRTDAATESFCNTTDSHRTSAQSLRRHNRRSAIGAAVSESARTACSAACLSA
jgi:hypothetical protein